jgi:hypothetical protein
LTRSQWRAAVKKGNWWAFRVGCLRWVKEIFPSLLRQRKCYKYKRDIKFGYVVLRKDETAAGQTYKYASVVGVHVGLDGKVRSADVIYKILYLGNRSFV